MTKFNDLCNAYKNSREKFFFYRDESLKFAKELIARYVQYLEIPQSQIKFIPLDKEYDPALKYSILGAMHLNEDAFWYLGVEITVYTAPNEHPQQALLFRFMFKQINNSNFLIRIGDEDSGHEVVMGDAGSFSVFFDFIQAQIVSNFENELQDFLEKSSPLKTIGFVQ